MLKKLKSDGSSDVVDLSALHVLFLSNVAEGFPIWHQRAGEFVCWDYHVILFDRTKKLILDLDSTLKPFPMKADEYFEKQLNHPKQFQEMYVQSLRLVDGDFFLRDWIHKPVL